MSKTERLHSLDSLRAIMMLLGIVLHSGETYNVGEAGIWPKDPFSAHVFFNYLNNMIHIFRMPIFFAIAGFFGSMLFYERGPKLMMKNRISRVVLPFVVFLLILHPVIITAINYTITSFGNVSFLDFYFPHLISRIHIPFVVSLLSHFLLL